MISRSLSRKAPVWQCSLMIPNVIRAIQNLQDSETLQSGMNKIANWCHDWRIELNESNCAVLHITRFREPTISRSQLAAYGSQVWATQTVNNILSLERIQRRATKFILSLPYQPDVSYKERLMIIGILPISFWYEYLDLVYLFKCITSNSD